MAPRPNRKSKLNTNMGKIHIFVIRCENGNLKYSKPCLECIEKMKIAKVYKVTYSTGCVLQPYITEKISLISNDWISSLTKSLLLGTFRLKSLKSLPNKSVKIDEISSLKCVKISNITCKKPQSQRNLLKPF